MNTGFLLLGAENNRKQQCVEHGYCDEYESPLLRIFSMPEKITQCLKSVDSERIKLIREEIGRIEK